MKSLFRVYCENNKDDKVCYTDFLTEGEDYEVFEVIKNDGEIRFRLVDDNMNLIKYGFPKRFFRTYEEGVQRLVEELSRFEVKGN